MNLRLPINNSLWTVVQGLFASKPADRTVLDDRTPRGINRTEFMGYTIQYPQPVMPAQTAPTRHLIRMFGIKRHTASFRKLTTAAQNTLKN